MHPVLLKNSGLCVGTVPGGSEGKASACNSGDAGDPG